MNMMDYNNPNDPWFNTGYDPYKGLNEKERIKVGCLQGAAFIVLIIMGLLLCAMLSGCTTTQYVPVIEHKTDTLIQTKVQKDSIWLHDSIKVSEKGDTVKIEKWHTKYIEKQVHDTTYISKRDTIPQPYPVVKMVEKPLSKTERGFILLGIVSLMGIVVWLALKLKRFLPLR